jgi:hypothetical protein
MVRRWSYINSVNSVYYRNHKVAERSLFDINTNAVMYLRKEFQLSTRFTRKSWARRKHEHTFLQMANVLKDWSHTYRFYRNHARMINSQFYTSQTYIAFNLTGTRNIFPGLHKNSGTVVTASYTNKLGSYFSKFSRSRLNLFGNFKNGNLILVSTKSFAQDAQDLNFLVQLPTIQYETEGLRMALPPSEVPSQSPRDAKDVNQLLNMLSTIWTQKLVVLYKVLTTLLLKPNL